MDVKTYAQHLIEQSYKEKVSDVYLLKEKDKLQIYFRKHTKRYLHDSLEKNIGQQLIRHFKFLAHMDIAEKRKPQLGAFTSWVKDEELRLRLSSVGDYLGEESLVLRFFQKTPEIGKNYLLFEEEKLLNLLKKRGLHLFVGPTGSGKTTLMYRLAKRHPNFQQVITIEDPVEIEEESFLQLQTNHKIGLDYETLIKVCLRHRPDCLIIGEIRDQETAQMVFRAALTGHVVLATLHGKNLKEIFSRLEELGISRKQTKEIVRCITFIRMVQVPCKFQCEKNSHCDTCKAATLTAIYPLEDLFTKLKRAWAYGFITDEIFYQEE